MKYAIRTCLISCPDYDPDTKTCRKVEEYPEQAKLGQPCAYDAEASKHIENLVEEALAKEGTIRQTVWNSDKSQKFKDIITISEKVKRLSPLICKKIFYPTDRDTTAMVFLYFPLPTLIFNLAMKNHITSLMSEADAVFFTQEDGKLKITFAVENIWAEIK